MSVIGRGRGISLTALTALLLLFSPLLTYQVVFAQFPIAQPGTEGFEVIVNSTSPVIATFQGYDAADSSDLYLVVDGTNDKLLFNNKTSPTGSTVNLGSFPVGTKLLFRLHDLTTGKDFFTGPGSRNPDGKPHARAQANWKPNETLVSFEDSINGDFDYNDLSFSFVPTTAVQSQHPPQIVRVERFVEGVLVFFRLYFTDPSNIAVGFGFRGANGSGWAEENHPFTSPSYGRIFPGIVEYPFNHLCGQPGAYESDVEAWIYDNTGRRSPSVTIHLACTGTMPAPELILREPAGIASNLVVLVHGCCTNYDDVIKDWDSFGKLIAGTIQPPGTWEIVVWDWSNYTPKLGYPPSDLLLSPRTAYENLLKYPDNVYLNLKDAIANHHYKNLHFLGHSTGAKLIQLTVEELVHIYKQRNEEPFIHLTFLDAFTLGASDKATYGFFAK